MKNLKTKLLLAAIMTLWLLGLTELAGTIFSGKADVFPALECLFSGLAFALLWQTLSLQRQELKLQRQELQRAVKAHEESAATLKRQLEYSETQPRIERTIIAITTLRDFELEGGFIKARAEFFARGGAPAGLAALIQSAQEAFDKSRENVFPRLPASAFLAQMIRLFDMFGLQRRMGLLHEALFVDATHVWRSEWILLIGATAGTSEPVAYNEYVRLNVLAFLAQDCS